MKKYDWSQLNHLQLGRYAEYLVKMEFTLYGFDVYTSEVDNKGIDFVIRKDEDQYYDVQVKSSRKLNYIFIQKEKLTPRERLLVAVVLFFDGKSPRIYLIPSAVWNQPDALFVSRDYLGRRSKPEWGLNLSNRNLKLLERYEFELEVMNL